MGNERQGVGESQGDKREDSLCFRVTPSTTLTSGAPHTHPRPVFLQPWGVTLLARS